MAPSEAKTVRKNYFRIHYFVLMLLGVSIQSLQKNPIGHLYKLYSIAMFTMVYIYFPLAEILYLVYNTDLENITSGTTYICTHTLGTLKIILILIFRKRITAFCELIETKPFLPDPNRSGDLEFDYVQDAINACNYQGYTFHIFVVAIVLPKIFYSLRDSEYETVFNDFQNATFLVQRQRAGPFNCVMPFNTMNSPYFEITAIYQASCAAILGCVIGSIDAIICGIMCHVKAQILILKESLRTYIQQGLSLMEEDNIDGENVIDESEMFRIIKSSTQPEDVPTILQKYVDISVSQIIIHHQKVIKLSQDAEETFSLLMLVQFLFSLSIICCQLFQLSILKMGSAQFYSMCFYAMLMLFQIFLFCYRGNEVMVHSYDLIDAIFQSNWTALNLKTQKSLLLMMTRACRPIRMTAGKFVFLSLEAFMSIVRGSGSYFMVLRSINMPEE